MKTNESANGKTSHRNLRPTAVLGAGQLVAFVWDSGADCHITIARVDREAGVIDQRLTPAHLVSLAKLTAMLGDSLSRFGELDEELQAEVGCLGCSIASVLGMELHDVPQAQVN